jgi:hypothetical protein
MTVGKQFVNDSKKTRHMKKIFLVLFISGLMMQALISQEANKQLDDARSAYNSGNLQDTRFALQQALREIDMAIGAEILKILPQSMSHMKTDESADNVTTAGFVGLFVTRSYKATEGEDYSSVEIISDSPMLAGINAMLALPMFGGDPNQKRIRVAGYRGLQTKNTDESGTVSWDIQVPMGTTLLTFRCNGPSDERKVTDMLNTIKFEEIAKLTR